MKYAQHFPGDLAVIEVRVRLRRTGRDEWLDDTATPTDDEAKAASFPDAVQAILFAQHHVDEPKLWHHEQFVEIK